MDNLLTCATKTEMIKEKRRLLYFDWAKVETEIEGNGKVKALLAPIIYNCIDVPIIV